MHETPKTVQTGISGGKANKNETAQGLTQEKLVQKAIQGDSEAIAELLESVTKTVLYYTSGTLRSRMDAEDAAQEVLVRVYTKIGTLKNPEKFKTWLRTIIVNETRRFMIKNYLHNDLDISEHPDIEDMDEDALPQVSAEKNERSEAVKRCIEKLTERQKEAVYSIHYLGLSVKDTAKAMGIRSQSVNDNLKLAYKKVEKELNAEGVTSAYGAGLLPIGAELSKVLLKEAEQFSIKNAGWIAHTIQQSGLLIKGAAVAGAAVTSVGAGTAVVAGAASSSVLTPVIIVATAVTVTSASLGVNYYVKNSSVPREIETPAVIQHGQVATDGGIIFSGGEESEHINPKAATVWVTDELTMLDWRITPKGSDETIFSGEGVSTDGVFERMLESGMEGRYIITFRMEDDVGGHYTVDREFAIRPEKPEESEEPKASEEQAEPDKPEESEESQESEESEEPEESQKPEESQEPDESQTPDESQKSDESQKTEESAESEESEAQSSEPET